MESSEAVGLVETVLFLENEAVDLATLRRITNLPRDVVSTSLQALEEEYSKPHHGVELVSFGDSYCFAPKREHWESVRYRYGRKNDRRLSRAALETLAIVAYSQPITKAEIEALRGVSADGMLKQLVNAGLVRVVGKKDSPGKPVQYGTTREFLKRFHLKSIAELPKLGEIERKKFEPDE